MHPKSVHRSEWTPDKENLVDLTEISENSHKQASVTQVLNLLNGYVEQRILGKKDAIVLNNVKNAGGMDSQIDTAFLSILNQKKAHIKEKLPLKTQSRCRKPNYYKEIVWVLVNSHEFYLFNNLYFQNL